MSDHLQFTEPTCKANRVIPLHSGIEIPSASYNVPTPGPVQERSFDGPISGGMWKKLSRLKSAYPDSFDWSMYDKLHARYGEKQPRGGVVFRTTLKLLNYHSACSKCHYSLELDTYGRGCIHNCVYCYAKEQLSTHGYWNQPQPMPVDLSEIRKIFANVFESDKKTKWRSILEERIPIRIGSMSDSFMWMDQKYKVSLELLRILNFYEYPYVVFTRSDLIARDEYLAALNANLASVQFSISSIDEALTRLIEPGAPSPTRRFAALRKLSDSGFWTTVRINPLFPTYPDGYYTDHRSIRERFGSLEAAPRFGYFDLPKVSEFISQVREARVPSLLAGFVRLTPTAIKSMSLVTGVDLLSFFKPEALKRYTERHYSDSEITYYYKIIQSECAKQGVRFNTCYIGNGAKDYYQHQNLWDNRRDCCDAVGNVPAFRTTAQSISWETRKKHTVYKDAAAQSQQLERDADAKFGHLATDTPLSPKLGLRVVPPFLLRSEGAEVIP